MTIADVTNGSSATGGGRLKSIGRVVDPQGKPISILPEAGIDIYTDATLGNAAIISNGRTLYFLVNGQPAPPRSCTRHTSISSIVSTQCLRITAAFSLMQRKPCADTSSM